MKYPSKRQLLLLHEALIQQTGGSPEIRDTGLLDSAWSAPLQTFDGKELYPSILEKATRLAFGLIRNHPFVDGNKRIGTHAMLVLLKLNGLQLLYDDEELITIILGIASGEKNDEALLTWLQKHIV